MTSCVQLGFRTESILAMSEDGLRTWLGKGADGISQDDGYCLPRVRFKATNSEALIRNRRRPLELRPRELCAISSLPHLTRHEESLPSATATRASLLLVDENGAPCLFYRRFGEGTPSDYELDRCAELSSPQFHARRYAIGRPCLDLPQQLHAPVCCRYGMRGADLTSGSLFLGSG